MNRALLGSKTKTRPRLARKHNIASGVGPTLQDAFFFPTRSIREASARQNQARCSAPTGRCKLLYASCTVQVAPRKLLRASWSLQVAPCKLLCANCSVQVAPCKLLCASCSVQVALRKLLCVSCFAQVALGKALCANWSVQVGLRKLLCATCSAQVALRKLLYASCILRRPPADQGGIEPAGPGPGSRRANHETQFEPQKSQKTSSFCTSTTPIPAEFLHLDHTDPRRRSREHRRNRKQKPWVFAPRPRRSPQRVARAPQKSQKTSSSCTSHADPRRGSREQVRNRKKPWVFAPRPRRSPQRVARAPQKSPKTEFLHLDHADPRRGSIFVQRRRHYPAALRRGFNSSQVNCT